MAVLGLLKFSHIFDLSISALSPHGPKTETSLKNVNISSSVTSALKLAAQFIVKLQFHFTLFPQYDIVCLPTSEAAEVSVELSVTVINVAWKVATSCSCST